MKNYQEFYCSKFYTVASTFKKSTNSAFTNSACTFISKILLSDKLQECKDRVQSKVKVT